MLGIDLGTGSVKGILANKQGEIVAEESSELELYSPKRNYSEQDPIEWYEAMIHVLKKITQNFPDVKDQLDGISFSGQMHSLVLLDKNDEVIRNAILWNDVRTTKQSEEIKNLFYDELLDITKNKALEGFTLPKFLWVQENEPENWSKFKSFLLPKDYLGFRLTGNKQMEYSDAAGTLLLDVKKREWSTEIFEKFNIDINNAPKLVESHEKIGTLDKEIAKVVEIEGDVPIFAGGADNPSAALGAGITRKDQAMVSIGTSGVVLAYEPNSKNDYHAHLHYFNHVLPDAYYSMGVTLAAGNSLDWYKDNFAENISYETLLENIDDINIGSNGLLFAPYISGERTPYTDSQIRKTFLGIDISHTRDHFTRSVLEGITFSLRDSIELMRAHADKDFSEIVSVGGGAKNSSWLQMQADIFNTPIVTLQTEQGPAMGATMLAAVGVGWFDSFKECAEAFVKYDRTYTPMPENVKKYEHVYANYQKVYPTIKDLSHNLSKQ